MMVTARICFSSGVPLGQNGRYTFFMGPSQAHNRLTRAAVGLLALAVVIGASAGCSEVLFDPKKPRTQYDRYDRIRGDYAPQYIEDEYGQRHPNLRGRLGRRN